MEKWKIAAPVLALAAGIVIGVFIPVFECCGEDCVCEALRTTYNIGGREVAMKAGVSAGSDGEGQGAVTRIERLPLKGDLDGDGKNETTVIMSQRIDDDVKYYITAISGADGTPFEALPMGGDVLIRDVEVSDGCVWVMLLSRDSGQASIGARAIEKILQYTIRDGKFTEV